MAGFSVRGNSVRATVRLPGGGRETRTFDTADEAKVWASEMERKKSLGVIRKAKGGSVTVAQMLEAYDLAVSSRTDSGRWNTLRIMKWLLDPLAKLPLAEVMTHDINEWISRRIQSVSGPTVNRELNLMSSAFNYAVKDRGWIEKNPCHGARRPERGRPRKRPLLTQDELRAIAVATGYRREGPLKALAARVGACFFLGLETGLRSGEMLRLRPRDYDRDARVLYVAALEPGGRKAARSGRAVADPSRSVPLTARAVEIIDQLLIDGPDPDRIVGLRDDQRDAIWRKARDMSGVTDLHFHDSKHEAATRMARFLDVLDLSHALGTKDIKLLRDTYYQADAKRSAALLPSKLSTL